MVSNSPRNRSELAKTVSVDDGHINPLLGLSIMEIPPGPKTVSDSAQNGPELAEIESVDNRHVNAPRGLLIMALWDPTTVSNSP